MMDKNTCFMEPSEKTELELKSFEDKNGELEREDAEQEEKSEIEREQWTHSFEFVLSLIGYAVGVSNLWRFPYLTLKNGGGM